MQWRSAFLLGTVLLLGGIGASSLHGQTLSIPRNGYFPMDESRSVDKVTLSNFSFETIAENETRVKLTLLNMREYSTGTLFSGLEFTPKDGGETIVIPLAFPLTLDLFEKKMLDERVALPRFLGNEATVSAIVYDENGWLIGKSDKANLSAPTLPSLGLTECTFSNGPAVPNYAPLDWRKTPVSNDINCVIKNDDEEPHGYTLKLRVYDRLFAGKTISTTMATGALDKKSTADALVSLGNQVLPPGAHFISLTLYDELDRLADKPWVFSLEQPGAGAVITLLKLDQGSYAPGKTAVASYAIEATGEKKNEYQTIFTLMNEKKETCAEVLKAPLTGNGEVQEVRLPVTADCATPTLMLTVRQDDVIKLAEKTITAEKTKAPSDMPQADGGTWKKLTLLTLAIIAVVGLALYLIRRHQRSFRQLP